MARPLGPLDRGERIDTGELLAAVADHGKHWPAVLSHYTLEAVSQAVGREILAGNLYDGSQLSPQGRAVLTSLRAAVVG